MSQSYGEIHSGLLDRGINLISIFPPDYITGLSSSYYGEDKGMLTLEQSPHLADPHTTRLSILGAIAGRATYGDENRFSFALSNHVYLPDGTHVQLAERPSRPARTVPTHLADNAVEVFGEISAFILKLHGNVWSAGIHADTTVQGGIEAIVGGTFTSDEMYTAYTQSLEGSTILDEQENPTTANSVRSIRHTILTPNLGQLVVLDMSDHRPGSREAMLELKAHPSN